jgi:hypothetical protein
VGSNRHNEAGRLIVKAICQGAKGANVVCADVGRKELKEGHGLAHLPAWMPLWLVPPQLTTTEQQENFRRTMRPDAIVVLNKAALNQANQANTIAAAPPAAAQTRHDINDADVVLLEIKYCRDTDPSNQQEAANEQHAQLLDCLRRGWRCNVQLVTVMLGAGGTIYSDLQWKLDALGVNGNAYKTLANKLNCLAAKYVELAMNCRYAKTILHSQPPGNVFREAGHSIPTSTQHFSRKRPRSMALAGRSGYHAMVP